MKKKLPLSSLEKKLDKVFSEWIRRKDADAGGTVACVSCGKLEFWRDLDCGHWIKRQHRSVRWDEINCGPQCSRCNRWMGGNMDEFAFHILNNHGEKAMSDLLAKKHKPVKFTRADLEALIAEYQGKVASL